MRLSSLLPLLLSLLWLCAAPGCEEVPATVLDAGVDQAVHDAAPDADAASVDASVDAMPDAPLPDAGPATVRVLFVGNSYTFVNDLPGQVSKLAAAAAGPALQTSSVAFGGATLKVHYEKMTLIFGGGPRTAATYPTPNVECSTYPPSKKDSFVEYGDASREPRRSISAAWSWSTATALCFSPVSSGCSRRNTSMAMQAGQRMCWIGSAV